MNSLVRLTSFRTSVASFAVLNCAHVPFRTTLSVLPLPLIVIFVAAAPPRTLPVFEISIEASSSSSTVDSAAFAVFTASRAACSVV